jgi:hypothetical protein
MPKTIALGTKGTIPVPTIDAKALAVFRDIPHPVALFTKKPENIESTIKIRMNVMLFFELIFMSPAYFRIAIGSHIEKAIVA